MADKLSSSEGNLGQERSHSTGRNEVEQWRQSFEPDQWTTVFPFDDRISLKRDLGRSYHLTDEPGQCKHPLAW